MKLLILGGTSSGPPPGGRGAGRRTPGHPVQPRPARRRLFPQVEKLRGDRDGGLDALAGRRWDAVIDTCGYVPRLVRASAELLAGSVDHYTFISSISVYRDLDQAPVDESSPVGVLADESVEEITGESYGPLKALCEQAAEAAMPGRVLTTCAPV